MRRLPTPGGGHSGFGVGDGLAALSLTFLSSYPIVTDPPSSSYRYDEVRVCAKADSETLDKKSPESWCTPTKTRTMLI